VSEPSKVRLALFVTIGTLTMMAVVALAQYLVSGRVSGGVMAGVGVPTGIILGQSLANKK
jgi:hypothetical protein